MTPVTTSGVGREQSHCMEESKEHSNACQQQPGMSTCSMVCKCVRVTKKDTTPTGTGGKSALLTQRGDRAGSASVAGIGPPGPQKDPFPSLPGGDTAAGLARCRMMHTLKQNKGAHTKSKTGKTTPHEAVSPA